MQRGEAAFSFSLTEPPALLPGLGRLPRHHAALWLGFVTTSSHGRDFLPVVSYETLFLWKSAHAGAGEKEQPPESRAPQSWRETGEWADNLISSWGGGTWRRDAISDALPEEPGTRQLEKSAKAGWRFLGTASSLGEGKGTSNMCQWETSGKTRPDKRSLVTDTSW